MAIETTHEETFTVSPNGEILVRNDTVRTLREKRMVKENEVVFDIVIETVLIDDPENPGEQIEGPHEVGVPRTVEVEREVEHVEELSRVVVRSTLYPGEDVSARSEAVQAAAAETWTPAVIAAWKLETGIGAPISPEQSLAYAISAIQTRRARAIEAFTFMGQSVTLSSQTQQDIGNAIAALQRKPEGAVISWEITDGVYVDMDLPTIEAFGDAAFDHVQAGFANSKALTAAAQAGEPYDIESGWPPAA